MDVLAYGKKDIRMVLDRFPSKANVILPYRSIMPITWVFY